MADLVQTEPLEKGKTEGTNSSNETVGTVNSRNRTNGLAFHNDSPDNKYIADEDEGVNGRMIRIIYEESGIEDNSKITDDRNDGINETIRKGGSDNVATCIDTRRYKTANDNETVSLCADWTIGKGDNTVGNQTCKAIYRGNGTKNSETNSEVTQKGNNKANDKGNIETGDRGYAEKTIAGTDKTTHKWESDQSKTNNYRTDIWISESVDERNYEVTQNGSNKTNDTGNNGTSDSSYAEKTETGADKTTHEGESGENKTGNDETNIWISEPANQRNVESTNWKGWIINYGKDVITEKVNADRTDANAKERSATFEEDSSSSEEGNDSVNPDGKMVTEMDRQETVNNASNDRILSEDPVYNGDANRQKNATVTCSNESHGAYMEYHDKKKENDFFSNVKKRNQNKKNEKQFAADQSKEHSVTRRDNKPIQEENKQLKKKYQELIDRTLEEKESNAITLNKMTTLYRAQCGELKQLREEKSDLLMRLRKVASAQLTQNNPNIADLSDANRPTKLADTFSELYDNEYTDAIDELKEQQGIEEQAAIENMLTLLQATNGECMELVRKQEDGMKCLITFSFKIDQYPILRKRSISTDPSDNEHPTVKTTADQETDKVTIEIQLPVDHRKSLFDIRTLCATKVEEECSMSEIIASKIALQRGITPESSHKMLAYLTKCAKLCWYMAMKEPPVNVGFHTVVDGELFNKDTYRAYAKAGALLDFVVWPPLYLYKGGPLLCKGVAQGK